MKPSTTSTTPIWGIHAGKTGDAASLFLSKNCVALGWHSMGDLSKLASTRDAFKAAVAQAYPNKKPGAIPNNAGQLFRFVHEMKVGDLVVFPNKSDRKIYLGEVTGSYERGFLEDLKVRGIRTPGPPAGFSSPLSALWRHDTKMPSIAGGLRSGGKFGLPFVARPLSSPGATGPNSRDAMLRRAPLAFLRRAKNGARGGIAFGYAEWLARVFGGLKSPGHSNPEASGRVLVPPLRALASRHENALHRGRASIRRKVWLAVRSSTPVQPRRHRP